jgi:hypothetical protein
MPAAQRVDDEQRCKVTLRRRCELPVKAARCQRRRCGGSPDSSYEMRSLRQRL